MPNPTRSDITIIGAGPAGLTAALALAKKGIACRLIDKNVFPRDKICGDGLGGKVISTLRRIDFSYAEELSASTFATSSYAVRFYSPSLHMTELSFKPPDPSQPPGIICKRKDFDNFLMTKAMGFKKISFSGGIRINRLVRKNDTMISEDDSGRTVAESRLVLFAAGMDIKLIQQLDPYFIPSDNAGLGIRGYFDQVTGSGANFAIEIHFLKELLPWYLWIFPFSDGSANVGLALPVSRVKKNDLSLKKLLFFLIDKYPYLKERFRNAELKGKIEAQQIPFFSNHGCYAGDNYMLLGDAASLIDPFTGEGIGNAMASGYMAAEIAAWCLEKNDFSAYATHRYEQKISEKIVPELSLGLKLHRLARSKALINLVIRKASHNENTRQMISEMIYDTGTKRNLNKPSFYLKLALGL
jgi:menaquinone-9 beta-reductase